ncbi:hypothetical protein PTTG_00924 [Puccinia triticina 1-1 BBBD Race 1]|uniref:Uncharacterized protein n=1 Tax=Puccinia triticina (isolate 1-1 / race 1 (BBBD)) TaxID=630390 RepID=A0A0C4EJK6_PUCT1|nr:hypothetical protein PTTG_00924 [Puccinia triticina 1-1 BBBD Race 1]
MIPLKQTAEDRTDTQVGTTKFVWGVSNSHNNGGFTPYFNKLILELKGPLPFTIFNREWQEKVLVYQLLNRPKTNKTAAEKGLCYHGFPVPDKWQQTFINWTLNHACAHKMLGVSADTCNCANATLKNSAFMLRYATPQSIEGVPDV